MNSSFYILINIFVCLVAIILVVYFYKKTDKIIKQKGQDLLEKENQIKELKSKNQELSKQLIQAQAKNSVQK